MSDVDKAFLESMRRIMGPDWTPGPKPAPAPAPTGGGILEELLGPQQPVQAEPVDVAPEAGAFVDDGSMGGYDPRELDYIKAMQRRRDGRGPRTMPWRIIRGYSDWKKE